MRSILQIVAVIVLVQLLTSCGDDPKQITAKPTKKLVVLAYDISKSNDEYAILKKDHLASLFSKIAFNGGGKFYGLLIKANSLKQELFEYNIPAFDTLELKGNSYQIKRRMKVNKKILAPFNKKKMEFVNKTKSAIIKPKNENATDIMNAIKLAEGTLKQNIYNNWDKTLIVISDGINTVDTKKWKNKSINFEDVKVILVRPTNTKYVTGSSLITTNSIQDALYNL